MPNQINKGQDEEITINELALWIKKGFDEQGQRMDELETRLNAKMDQRFDEMEKKMNYRFDGLQNQIDNIYTNYTQRREYALLCERVRKVERKAGITSPRISIK